MEANVEDPARDKGAFPIKSLVQEIRYSIRSLAKRPLVAVVAVLSLSLGIGINT